MEACHERPLIWGWQALLMLSTVLVDVGDDHGNVTFDQCDDGSFLVDGRERLWLTLTPAESHTSHAPACTCSDTVP